MTGARIWVSFAVTLVLLIAATALLVSSALRRIKGASAERVAGESLYREVMDRAVREHVDPIDAESAVYGAVKGLVSGLDPHSRVFDAAEWADFQRESRGEMTGIGLEIEEIDGALVVAWVSPGSPADLASIRAGDRILAAGATEARSGRAAVLAALEGKRGSRIGLHLSRYLGGERRVEVIRETFDVATVHTRKLQGGILYARISAFRPQTFEAFDRAVRDAGQEGRNGIILDLRFNRGGSFEAAVAVADAWLSRGAIVRTKGPAQDELREATPEAPLEAVPTVVLVNWATASAAEVVAAALQDAQAGILVGERTFGKGVVQEVVEFESWPGGGMKLTTGRLFSPAGRCVDRGRHPTAGETVSWGLLPDFVVPVPEMDSATLERTLERDRYPEWIRTRRAPASGSDPQLEAALELVAGRPADFTLTR